MHLSKVNPGHLSKRMLEVIPPAMQRIRLEMRAAVGDTLTIPQFRIIGCIFRGNDSVTGIAKHMGVSQAAMSKMVDVLVTRSWVRKERQGKDRRQLALKVTRKGDRFFQNARKHARASLKAKITAMTSSEMQSLDQGLSVLEQLLESMKQEGLRR